LLAGLAFDLRAHLQGP